VEQQEILPIGNNMKRKDFKKSKDFYQEAVNLTGLAINEKNPIKKDLLKKKILKLLKKATSLGNCFAQNEMAQHYDEFGLFGQNDVKAVRWYKIASKNGHIEANNNLAHAYETGIGIKKNLKKANLHYLIAARKGSLNAQYNMGIILEKIDIKASMKWLEKSLKGGNRGAALKLANIYAYNAKVKNIKAAQKYLKKVKDLNEVDMEEAAILKKYLSKLNS